MSDPFIGEIILFAGNFAPRGWAFCAGQLLPISQNEALFSVIGTIYGGDGRTTFALPDLRGRAPIGEGSGPGLTNRTLGSKVGEEAVRLSVNQIPAHTHTGTVRVDSGTGTSPSPVGTYLAQHSDDVNAFGTTHDETMAPDAIDNASTGGGQSHDNIQPSLTLNYIIAMQGIFPPHP